jgi:hypothetical protein
MLHEIESPATESERPAPVLPSKPASLTGALVQRGRDRGPRLRSVPLLDAEPAAPAPAAIGAEAPAVDAPASHDALLDEVPLVFVRPKKAAPKAMPAAPSRWSEAMFVAACCAAFFATFLFVLRF